MLVAYSMALRSVVLRLPVVMPVAVMVNMMTAIVVAASAMRMAMRAVVLMLLMPCMVMEDLAEVNPDTDGGVSQMQLAAGAAIGHGRSGQGDANNRSQKGFIHRVTPVQDAGKQREEPAAVDGATLRRAKQSNVGCARKNSSGCFYGKKFQLRRLEISIPAAIFVASRGESSPPQRRSTQWV